MKIYNIFGLRRSGNHAIIEYIAQSFEHTVHYNDCMGWQSNRFSKSEFGELDRPQDCQIYSYEDFEPTDEQIQDPSCFIILRDYLNIAASRLKSNRGCNTCRQQFQSNRTTCCEKVWSKYWDLYTRYPHKTIIYNYWHSDINYRIYINDLLELNNSIYQKYLPESGVGQGSSFDNLDTLNDRYKNFSLDELTSNNNLITRSLYI